MILIHSALVEVDDIFGYDKLVAAEKANLQAGMNYREGREYSVVLMSVRKGAPYADSIDPVTGMILYEGHDVKKFPDGPDPKSVDQPLTNPGSSLTENGKFYRDAIDFKSGKRKKAKLVKAYEKISKGIWSYKGFFELIDANIVSDGKRKVFKFSLKPVEKKSFGRVVELPHNRLIPTLVKVEVWRRDGGQCMQCGSKKNLHFDHDIPFSKGGSSLTAANVRLLCAKHNLEKSDKILSVAPWILTGAAVATQFQKLRG
jgi:HNH endonuclease